MSLLCFFQNARDALKRGDFKNASSALSEGVAALQNYNSNQPRDERGRFGSGGGGGGGSSSSGGGKQPLTTKEISVRIDTAKQHAAQLRTLAEQLRTVDQTPDVKDAISSLERDYISVMNSVAKAEKILLGKVLSGA